MIHISDVIPQGHRALSRMEPLALLKLVEIATGHPADSGTGVLDENIGLDFGCAYWIWTYFTLKNTGILPPDQLLRVLTNLRTDIMELGDYYETNLEHNDNLSPCPLTIADRRYIKLPSREAWYDSVEHVDVETVPPTFEGISYNLSLLAVQEWKRIQTLKETRDGARETRTEDPD